MPGREGFHLSQKEDTGWNRALKDKDKVFLLSYCFDYEHRGLEYPELLLCSEHSNQAHLLPVISNTSNLHFLSAPSLGKVKPKEIMAPHTLLTSWAHPLPAPFFSFHFRWEKVETTGLNFLLLLYGYIATCGLILATKTIYFINTVRIEDYLLELLLAPVISPTFALSLSRIQEKNSWNKRKGFSLLGLSSDESSKSESKIVQYFTQ